MFCDGQKKVMIIDDKGRFLGCSVNKINSEDWACKVIPKSEFQWDDQTDRRGGVGDFRVPKVMTTWPNGTARSKGVSSYVDYRGTIIHYVHKDILVLYKFNMFMYIRLPLLVPYIC